MIFLKPCETFRYVRRWMLLDWQELDGAVHDHFFTWARWKHPDTGSDLVTVRCMRCSAALFISTSLFKEYGFASSEDPDEEPMRDANHLAYRICITWGYLCEEAKVKVLLEDVQKS